MNIVPRSNLCEPPWAMTDTIPSVPPTEDRLTAADVGALRHAGLLPAPRFLDAVFAVRNHRFWDGWARRALLALGIGHVLAGIVFFFAYNWADLPSWAKFAIVDTGLVAAIAGTFLLGPDRPAGRACLIAASVLTGVLLAVIGQVYQTGADAYDLFAAWTVLILPFVLAARQAAHSMLWLAVAYTAAVTYAGQVLVPEGVLHSSETAAAMAGLLSVALLAWEAATRGVQSRHPRPWARRVLLTAAGLHALGAVCAYLLFDEGTGLALAGGAVLLMLYPPLCAGPLRDRAAFAIAVGYAGLAVMAAGYWAVERTIWQGGADRPALLLGLAMLVAWCAATASVMTLALRRMPLNRRPA